MMVQLLADISKTSDVLFYQLLLVMGYTLTNHTKSY